MHPVYFLILISNLHESRMKEMELNGLDWSVNKQNTA
jgi:hypothetical protein